MANDSNLGSAAIGFEVDLKNLQAQMNQASKIISRVTSDANTDATKQGGKGGILGSLMGSAGSSGMGLSLLSNFQGSLGRVGTAVSGVGRLFSGMGTAAAGAGISMGALLPVVGAIALAIGGAIVAVKGFQLAIEQMKAATAAAGDQQQLNTTFETMQQNLGLSAGKVQQFREELQKMSFTSDQSTEIMTGLVRSLGANGLSQQALLAVGAMRDLSAVAGQTTAQGVTELTHAITTLNPQLLDQYGITQTATQIFDAYGATINKTADSMSITEKQQAILNAVMTASAASAGTADRAANDLNRSATRLQANFKSLQAGVGQVFLPLASGIVSTINSEVLGLSNSVDQNAGKFKALGESIASRVIPMVQALIAWIKNLPWTSIVNGIYVTLQFLQILGRIFVGVGKNIVIFGRIAFASLRFVAAGISTLIGIAQLGASVLANFWNVVTGKTSINQAVSNLKNEASALGSVVFDEISKSFSDTVDAVGDYGENIVNTFSGIAGDFKQIAKGFDIGEFFAGLPAGLAPAAAEALDDFKKAAGGMSKEAMKAAKKMAEDLAKENADFARKQADALRDYSEQLADMVASHRDRIDGLRKDINKETKQFEKAQSERTADYQAELDRLSKADRDRKNDVQTQLAEELAKGRFADQTKIAQLQSRLAYEDAANVAAVEAANQNYQKDTANATTEHNERLAEIQKGLDAELAIQQRHAGVFNQFRDHQIADDITKLQQQYARRKAEDERAHQERLAEIIKQGTEQAAASGTQGQNIGKSFGGGIAGGIAGMNPTVKAQGDKLGQTSGQGTQEGMEKQKEPTTGKLRGIMGFVGTVVGGALGSIFGPFGMLIGGVIGNAIGKSEVGQAIGSGLKTAFEFAVDWLKRGWDFGKKILSTMGKAIGDSMGVVGSAFKSAWGGLGLPGFASGGIVGGRSGIDSNVAAVTKGEMILNKDQQQRMFSMLNGTSTGGGNTGSGNMIIEQLSVSLPSVRNADDFARELQLKFATLRST